MVTEITNYGTVPLLEKTMAFAAARNKVLVTNIANITTPGYRTKQLDVASFQRALRDASKKRDAPDGPLKLAETKEVRSGADGLLQVKPTEEPAENLLFQDGTNARIERQMSLLAENSMVNQAASELLKGAFNGLEKAIRGRVI